MTKRNGAVIEQHDATAATGSKEGREGRFKFDQPYAVNIQVEGVAPLVMHRYDCAAFIAQAESSRGRKGSASKKTDNVPSYVYRVPGPDEDEKREIGIPGYVVKAALVSAGKSFKDPRNARARALDLIKASILVPTEVASLGKTKWDYEDMRPCVINKARIPRVRPAFKPGWQCSFTVEVAQPEYITVDFLREIVDYAGKFCGFLEMRPDCGRFKVNTFEVIGGSE